MSTSVPDPPISNDGSTPSLPPSTVIALAIVGALLATITATAFYKLYHRPNPDAPSVGTPLDPGADRPKSQDERMKQVRRINANYAQQRGQQARAEWREHRGRYSKFSVSELDGTSQEDYYEADIGQAQPDDYRTSADHSIELGTLAVKSWQNHPSESQRIFPLATLAPSLHPSNASSKTEPFPPIPKFPDANQPYSQFHYPQRSHLQPIKASSLHSYSPSATLLGTPQPRLPDLSHHNNASRTSLMVKELERDNGRF